MPQTIKEVLDNLNDSDRRTLDYAFENNMSHFIRLPKGGFVGVNIGHLTYLVPQIKTGRWSYGNDESIRKETNGKIE